MRCRIISAIYISYQTVSCTCRTCITTDEVLLIISVKSITCPKPAFSGMAVLYADKSTFSVHQHLNLCWHSGNIIPPFSFSRPHAITQPYRSCCSPTYFQVPAGPVAWSTGCAVKPHRTGAVQKRGDVGAISDTTANAPPNSCQAGLTKVVILITTILTKNHTKKTYFYVCMYVCMHVCMYVFTIRSNPHMARRLLYSESESGICMQQRRPIVQQHNIQPESTT